MSRFAIRYPYLFVVACLMILVLGTTSFFCMPVDLFPPIKIPVVVVATFFSGMPPEQVENDITGRFERFFTLASGVDHMESRSLSGVSLIKVYFQPGVSADSAVTSIANLAMANLRKLPPGTLPPVVLSFDSSSLPVCLVTLKGKGLNETELRDLGQFTVRNQLANVPGASVPQPFGGRYRQVMVYVDPQKLEAHQLSVMDVVRKVNAANLIMPAGDVKIGPFDYNLYANSQIESVKELNHIPLKTVGGASVLVGNVGKAQDAAQIQNCIVRIDGQRSVYLPVFKQGGDANTLSVVNGIKRAASRLLGVPHSLVAHVAFDQSVFVRAAIKNLVLAAAIALLLAGLLIQLFLGQWRGTAAVFLAVPISVLAAFVGLWLGGSTINTMILGGLVLALSRLIHNSVVVLESIFRHLEAGEAPAVAAERGSEEVATAVLGSTLATLVVFFPVTLLYGVSRFLFSALGFAVVLSVLASYFIAMTIVPLFCAKLLRVRQGPAAGKSTKPGWGGRFNGWFKAKFERALERYGAALYWMLDRPLASVAAIVVLLLLSIGLYPLVGKAYFPSTDSGQFVINLKAQTGLRIERTDELMRRAEALVREVIPTNELGIVVANTGVTPGFASIYTPNSGPHTGFLQVGLRPGHRVSSREYMRRIAERFKQDLPELSAYFQNGGMIDAVVNMGMPAPLDIQVTSSHLKTAHDTAVKIARQVRNLPGISGVLVPQDMDYPALKLDVDRLRAAQLGLSAKEVVDSVITALTSDAMVAPSYWVDPKSGNDYLLTVQYPENFIKSLDDLGSLPLRSPNEARATRLENVSRITHMQAPTEVDHYQLQRTIDVYATPKGEDLKRMDRDVQKIVGHMSLPEGVRVTVRGAVEAMNSAFRSFGYGLPLATLLVYLILVAQFRSFLDPFLILMAVPAGLAGTMLTLFITGNTLNVMSLMGTIMMVGIVIANSILIVEYVRRVQRQGTPLRRAVWLGSRASLRPIIVTSLATLVGLAPLAANLGTGGEVFAAMALAIIGGLALSFVLTIFLVPAIYYAVYSRLAIPASQTEPQPHAELVP